MGLSVRRWPAAAFGSPQGATRQRILCLLETIAACETPSAEVSPQVYRRKKIKVCFLFFLKGVFFFKSHSQFENKYSGHIVLNQYLEAHSVGLKGHRIQQQDQCVNYDHPDTLFSENIFLNA